MCDHCSKVTSQKGYSGQVTCRCEHPEKKVEEKAKDIGGGCCSRKARESAGGCCQSTCCKEARSMSEAAQSKKGTGGGCCKDRK